MGIEVNSLALRHGAEVIRRFRVQAGNRNISDAFLVEILRGKDVLLFDSVEVRIQRVFDKIARRVRYRADRYRDRRRVFRRRRQYRRGQLDFLRRFARLMVSRSAVRFLAERFNAEVILRRRGQTRDVELRDLVRKVFRRKLVSLLDDVKFTIQRVFHNVASSVRDLADR